MLHILKKRNIYKQIFVYDFMSHIYQGNFQYKNKHYRSFELKSSIDRYNDIMSITKDSCNSQKVQQDINNIVFQFSKGNFDPGIGSGTVKHTSIRYARGRNGGRVYYHTKEESDKLILEILGKSDKHKQDKICEALRKHYGHI